MCWLYSPLFVPLLPLFLLAPPLFELVSSILLPYQYQPHCSLIYRFSFHFFLSLFLLYSLLFVPFLLLFFLAPSLFDLVSSILLPYQYQPHCSLIYRFSFHSCSPMCWLYSLLFVPFLPLFLLAPPLFELVSLMFLLYRCFLY